MKPEDIDDALDVVEDVEGPLTRLVQAVRRWFTRIRERRAVRRGES